MYVLLTSVVYEVEPAEQILKSTFYKTRWQHFSALDALLHKHIAAREGGGSFAIQSQVEDSGNAMVLNAKDIIPRPAGGGGEGIFEPSLWFFANISKTAAVFGTPYHASFLHM